MKKTLLIVLGIAAVAGIGYLVMKKMGNPKVIVKRVDWNAGTSDIVVDGQTLTITRLLSASIKNGYSVGFGQSYWSGSNGMDITSIDLKKNGSIWDTIAYRS